METTLPQLTKHQLGSLCLAAFSVKLSCQPGHRSVAVSLHITFFLMLRAFPANFKIRHSSWLHSECSLLDGHDDSPLRPIAISCGVRHVA